MNFVKIDIESEYDLIQLIGEGWISKVYLAGQRGSVHQMSIQQPLSQQPILNCGV